MTDWGSYKGLRRKPCSEDPRQLAGLPIGMYHCPDCGMMVLAALAHPSPGATQDEKDHPHYPLDDYEDEYQRPWPPGYYPTTGDPGDETTAP
jgi:hypothetical protein